MNSLVTVALLIFGGSMPPYNFRQDTRFKVRLNNFKAICRKRFGHLYYLFNLYLRQYKLYALIVLYYSFAVVGLITSISRYYGPVKFFFKVRTR